MNDYERKLVDRLRQTLPELNQLDISDEELLKATKGTVFRGCCALDMATEEFSKQANSLLAHFGFEVDDESKKSGG